MNALDILRKQEYRIILLLFLDILSFSVSVAIVPLYVLHLVKEEHNGYTEAEAMQRAVLIQGGAACIDGLLKFICQPIMGRLSDTYGRKRLILISQIGSCLCYFLYIVCPSLNSLFASYTLHGVTQCTFPVGLSMVADIASSESRKESNKYHDKPKSDARNLSNKFALANASVGAAFIVGPLIGAFVSRRTNSHDAPDFSKVFALNCILFLCAITFSFVFVNESLPPEKRQPFSLKRHDGPWTGYNIFLRSPFLKRLVLCHLINSMSLGIYGIWVLYMKHRFHWAEGQVGVLLSVNGVTLALSQTIIVRMLVPRILNDEVAIMFAYICNALALVAVALSPTGNMVLFSIVLFGIWGGLADPLLKATMSKQANQDQQGALQGAISSVVVFGQLCSNIVYPVFFQYFISGSYLAKFPPRCEAISNVVECFDGGLPGFPFFVQASLFLVAALIISASLREQKNAAYLPLSS